MFRQARSGSDRIETLIIFLKAIFEKLAEDKKACKLFSMQILECFFKVSRDMRFITIFCCMCDQQRLRSPCAYAQSDQSLCKSLEYSMSVELLTEQYLEFLSLKGGCTGLLSLSMSKCHIVRNQMSGLKLSNSLFTVFGISSFNILLLKRSFKYPLSSLSLVYWRPDNSLNVCPLLWVISHPLF